MSIYIMIAIIITNLVAITLVYQFIKKLDKKQIIIFMAISVAMMYGLVSLVYWISGIGIENDVHEASKNFVVYMFVPINVILFVPYIASKYMKLKEKEIEREYFAKKVEIMAILLAVVLLLEFFYFKNIQSNIKTTRDKITSNSSSVSNTTTENYINAETIKENLVTEIYSNGISVTYNTVNTNN